MQGILGLSQRDAAYLCLLGCLVIIQGCSENLGGSSGSPPAKAATADAGCTLDGQFVANGAQVTAYQAPSVAQGQSCQSETLTCQNGTLAGGNYSYSLCSVAAALPCTFNGQIIASGGTVTAYELPSVLYGETCQSQTLTCNNGQLTGGTYTNSSCTVDAQTTCAGTYTLTTTDSAGSGTCTLAISSVQSDGSFTSVISNCTPAPAYPETSSGSCINGAINFQVTDTIPGGPSVTATYTGTYTPGGGMSGTGIDSGLAGYYSGFSFNWSAQ